MLRQRNPWWRDADEWLADEPKLLYADDAPFEYEPTPLAGLTSGGLYTLTGPRRVGKSLEIKRKIRELIQSEVNPRSIIFCSCDGFTTQDLRRLFNVARGVVMDDGRPLWWFIDEITAVDGEWSSVVKEARDNSPLIRDCVVLTGSSARGLDEATKDFAVRRGEGKSHDRLLLPVGFRTFCRLSGKEIGHEIKPASLGDLQAAAARESFEELSFWTEDLHQLWINYLRVGGFPQAIREMRETGDALSFARDLWDVMEGEALLAAGMSAPKMSGLLGALVEGLTSPVNASRIQRNVGFTTHSNVYDRLFSLEKAYLIWLCYQDHELRPNFRAQRKIYFTDPLLARALAHRNPAFAQPVESTLSEQQAGFALLRSIKDRRPGRLDPSETVMYRRTSSKSEIDFVGPEFSVPIEIKYSDTGWARAAQILRANSGSGIVATRRTTDTSGVVWAVPVANLCWALDRDAPTSSAQSQLPGLG